jgi:hypothetical protein
MESVGDFLAVWYILWPFDIIYARLVQLVVIWYIFSRYVLFGSRKIWQPWLTILFNKQPEIGIAHVEPK